jgi:hypothetical protein
MDGGARQPDVQEDDAGGPIEPTWLPLDPSEPHAGRSLSAWVSDWTAWHLSFRDCVNNPYYDYTGSQCQLNQSTSATAVFYLEGGD